MTSFGPEDLLNCYRRGIFPMSDDRDDDNIFLIDPTERGVIPLDGLHISRSMRKVMARNDFTVTFDQAFPHVISLCAEAAPDRKSTWINHGIEHLYTRLHEMNHAHSVEVWRKEVLIGALYGVSIGGAFFGESMVSRAVITPHLASMGAVEITRDDYQKRLKAALLIQADFHSPK